MEAFRGRKLVQNKSGKAIQLPDVGDSEQYRLSDGSILIFYSSNGMPLACRYRDEEALRTVLARLADPRPIQPLEDIRGLPYSSLERLRQAVTFALDALKDEGFDVESVAGWKGIRRLGAYVLQKSEDINLGEALPAQQAGLVLGELLNRLQDGTWELADSYPQICLSSGVSLYPVQQILDFAEAGRKDLVRFVKGSGEPYEIKSRIASFSSTGPMISPSGE
jgi:biotin operon repressor